MEVFSNLFREMEDFTEGTKKETVEHVDIFKTARLANLPSWHLVISDNRTRVEHNTTTTNTTFLCGVKCFSDI